MLTVKPLLIATSWIWSPRRMVGAARAAAGAAGGGGLAVADQGNSDPPAKRLAAHRDRAHGGLGDLDRLRAGGEMKAPVDRRGRPAGLADAGAQGRGDAAVQHLQILEALRRDGRGPEGGQQDEASEIWHHHSLSNHSRRT